MNINTLADHIMTSLVTLCVTSIILSVVLNSYYTKQIDNAIENDNSHLDYYVPINKMLKEDNQLLSNEISELSNELTNLKAHAQEIAALIPVANLLTPNEIDNIINGFPQASPFNSNTRITSRFGEGTGYQGKLRIGHLGNDLVPNGEWYVNSMWPGEVADIGIDYYLGKYIIVQHSEYVRTLYAHLNTIFYTALPGESVDNNSKIGVMGNTGNSDGAHLHIQLEVFDGEKWTPIDIYPWLKGHGGK